MERSAETRAKNQAVESIYNTVGLHTILEQQTVVRVRGRGIFGNRDGMRRR